MLSIFLLLLPLFSIIGIGYLVGRSHIGDASWVKVLNLFGYYVAFPALIYNGIASADISFDVYGRLIITYGIFAISLVALSWLVTKWLRLSRELQNTFTVGIYFANTAYIGLPAVGIVFGDAAAGEAAVIVAIMVLVVFTLGVGILEASKKSGVDWSEVINDIVRNPLLWAALAGTVVSLTGMSLYEPLQTLVDFLAAAASPAVLVALGVFIALNHPKPSTIKIAAVFTGIKMLLIPGAFTLLLWLLPNSDWLDVFYIQAGMPLAITMFALSEIYPMDKGVVSSTIVFSTLASIFIVPLMMWVSTVL